ncbi:CobW family GTP-binding protein [Streptomyces sp. DT171]|uniref:CobW family GTP-binding protein n=1 Tax=Streptomyces sp. DT171 TaxID=3416524 RepID=UPI003CECDD91
MTPPRKQIPVIVLAGFLGSGKTTLLNHLLRHRAGNRIGVIVNDFGAIEIDAMTVSGQVGSTVSLGNGCLCCAVDASELDTFLGKLTGPAARLDVIVIEASGLAEPQELVRMLLASDDPHIVYGGLVEVVDAAEFGRTRRRHPEIDRHLAVADLVVLNKTDRIDEAEEDRLRSLVEAMGSGAAVISATHGRIDPELLFDPAHRPDADEKVRQLTFEDLLQAEREREHERERERERASDGQSGGGHGHHPHAAYESVAFTADVPMSPRRFMAFLDSRPEGLYRIKGFVDFGPGDPRHRYALHAVGRFLRFVPQPWARDGPRLTQLVLIGTGLDAPALSARLADCRESGTSSSGAPRSIPQDIPQDADALEQSMWGVLRYVQQPDDEA